MNKHVADGKSDSWQSGLCVVSCSSVNNNGISSEVSGAGDRGFSSTPDPRDYFTGFRAPVFTNSEDFRVHRYCVRVNADIARCQLSSIFGQQQWHELSSIWDQGSDRNRRSAGFSCAVPASHARQSKDCFTMATRGGFTRTQQVFPSCPCPNIQIRATVSARL